MNSEKVRQNEMNLVLERVNKTNARKAFEKGESVYLLPVNCSVNGMWVLPCRIRRIDGETESFDFIVDDYTYYNCVKELGSYAKFYLEVN